MYSIRNIGRIGPKVLLLHGLYSSSGEWLPVLKYLKESRLTLITIDYHNVILNDKIPDLIRDISSALPEFFDVAIGHSYGCYFLSLLQQKFSQSINVAPPYLASNFHLDEYLNYIFSSKNLDAVEVQLVVKRAITMNAELEFIIDPSSSFLIPMFDQFFSYPQGLYGSHYFDGGHTDVELAFKIALEKKLIKC